MDKSQPTNIVRKRNPQFKILLWLIGLILVNVLAYQIWYQIDLTQDKRYSIHPRTEQMLRNIDQTIHIRLFLTGDKLPSSFKRLSKSAEEMLRMFRDMSRNKIEYTVIDPMRADTSLLRELAAYGITNFPVTVAEGKGKTTQIPVTPYALVEQGDKKLPVLLQSYKTARLSEADFIQSIVKLEYNLAQAIKRVSASHPDSILYLVGHGESDGYEVFQLANELSTRYVFHADTLQRMPSIPSKYKAVIINQPKLEFDDLDKYKLDQYLLKGGSLLFNLKTTTASFDSLMYKQAFTAVPLETNLTNLLFNYGMRIGSNIVSDLEQCVDIPLQHEDNTVTQSELYAWPYFPIYTPNEDHPITKNITEVLGRFPAAIELVNEQPGLKKTVLTHTSKYSKIQSTPLLIDITSVILQPERHEYNKKNVPTGVITEGMFSSVYAGRLPVSIGDHAKNMLKQSEKAGRVVVFSDGDVFNNEVSQQSGPKEMGTYLFSPYVFDNKNLLLNTLEYLTDSMNLLDVQSKNYQASLLDKVRTQNEASKWQAINIGVPASIVIIFGLIFTYIRKRKYAGKID